MLCTPAASDDWSGRFLGMTLVGDVVSDEAERLNASTDLRPVREASAYIPALPTTDSRPSYDLQPHGSSSLFVEDHEELGILDDAGTIRRLKEIDAGGGDQGRERGSARPPGAFLELRLAHEERAQPMLAAGLAAAPCTSPASVC